MVNIKIKVNGADISVSSSDGLTVGMVGATYEIAYDAAWDDLSKLVIFRAGQNQLVALDGQVPPALLREANVMLQAGVEGRNRAGQVVIPTIWADVGYVLPSATAGNEEIIDPANPAWKQSAALAQEALDKANAVQQRADSGEFQGSPGPRL